MHPGAGNILVFNNELERPSDEYSSIDEIVPPVDRQGIYAYTLDSSYKPDQQLWMYIVDDPTVFRSDYVSSAQRLPNGNTLIRNEANGILFGVTA